MVDGKTPYYYRNPVSGEIEPLYGKPGEVIPVY